jgi:glycosyltransferase involved in cell wall biosynthesis
VYNAIEVDSFPFEEKKEDFALFIGRFIADKAPHLAIEAAKRAGIRIVLAGKVSMPDERAYFDAMIAPQIDGQQVEFVGEADAAMKRELYSKARCLLNPLQWPEPFGLVMIEAMACGTPPIVINRGAAAEIVCDGENGFLVEDVAEMAARIADVDTISPHDCRASVEARFSPASLADGYLKVYDMMLNEERFPAEPALVRPRVERMLATPLPVQGDRA